MMVVGISAVLIVGLSAVIEIPRMALEHRETGQSVSSVDRALSTLDRDIRFARDVEVSDGGRTLSIEATGGQTVTYTWGGVAGDPVIRSDGNGDASVAKGVQGCQFALKQVEKQVATGVALATAESVVETASFDTFQLKPGYTWATGLVGRLLQTVTQTVSVFGISDLRRPGFYIEPTGLDGDAGSCASLRARLRRYGSGDLRVRIYESDNHAAPKRDKLVGLGVVPNASLPGTFADVSIPLTSVLRLKGNKKYFVELSADRGDFAAEMQVTTVSDLGAIIAPAGGLTRSLDSGASFAPFSANLSTSQAPFSLTAVLSETITDTVASTYDTVYVTTAVSLELKLETPNGAESLEAAFPLQNNLAGL